MAALGTCAVACSGGGEAGSAAAVAGPAVEPVPTEADPGAAIAAELDHWGRWESRPMIEELACARDVCEVEVPDVAGTLTVLRGQAYDPLGYLAVALQLRALGGIEGASVLDIGTGAGPLAAMALSAGARRVVATDIHPTAVRNARDNATRHGWAEQWIVRQVSTEDPGAYAVIGEDERFDLILANPPALDREPASIDDYIQSDPGFAFVCSIVRGAPAHLRDDGRLWLTYNVPAGIERIRALAGELNLDGAILFDDRREDLFQHTIRPTVEDYAAELTPIIELRPRASGDAGPGERRGRR